MIATSSIGHINVGITNTLVLTALAQGPRRYSDLARTIAGISRQPTN
jgi:DNA-binding HxlR family transcriptional regulator